MEDGISSEGWLIIGTLGGVIVTSIMSFLAMFFNNRFQMKRLRHQLLVKTAVESYKANLELGVKISDKGGAVTFEPIINYLIKLSVAGDVFGGAVLTNKKIKQVITEMSRVDAVIEEANVTADNEATE